MTEPSKWAMETAEDVNLNLPAARSTGREDEVDAIREIAIAIDAARRRALEEAAHYTACRSPFEHPTTIAFGIRAFIDQEPTP